MKQARKHTSRLLAAQLLGVAAIIPIAAATVSVAPASTQSICDVLPLWPGCEVKPKS
jgi:hypothetical protein